MEINITGGVAEWLKVPHSKCGRGEILSEVRILPPPQSFAKATELQAMYYAHKLCGDDFLSLINGLLRQK